MTEPLRVGLISLGCAKNLVDAEIMLGSLLKSGVEITNDAAQADAVIVNTCSFIDSAQEESVDTILESVELRDANQRGQAVIVSGCLPQRFRDELPKLMPEVDAFMGIDQVAQVGDIVGKAHCQPRGKNWKQTFKINKVQKRKVVRAFERTGKKPRRFRTRKRRIPARHGKIWQNQNRRQRRHLPSAIRHLANFGRHRAPGFHSRFRDAAFPPDAETFCLFENRRGLQPSVQLLHHSPDARLAPQPHAEGHRRRGEGADRRRREGDQFDFAGLDLLRTRFAPEPFSRAISSPEKFSAAAKSLAADATTICTLLRELNSLKGDFWIRLLYTHPAHWTDELIQTIAECKKVARYVDMPLQHIHENMLERMRRETSQQYIVDLIKKIRAGVPGIALRTTFIVGFPGETEASFNTLLDFIRETKFERLGVFAYSKEDGTRAGAMAGQISDKVKQKRRELAMAAQHKVAVAVSESFVGREIKVLVEGEANAKQLAKRQRQFVGTRLDPRDGPAHELRMKGHNYLVARGEADAPDIDGRVYIRGKACRSANLPESKSSATRITI